MSDNFNPQPNPQGSFPQAAYPQNNYPQNSYSNKTNVMAIISLVLSFFFWPAGLVTGLIARSQIRRTGEGGAGMAMAGVIISALWGLLTILFLIAIWIPTMHKLSTSPMPVN